jgi:hypothetical protein
MRVSIIEPPGGVPAGWDAADALASGYDETQAMRLIMSATAAKPERFPKTAVKADEGGGGRRRGRPPQRDQLMGYLRASSCGPTTLTRLTRRFPSSITTSTLLCGHRASGIG